MSKKIETAIRPTREENYPEWYQQVIQAANLAENSPVRGCMIIKPHGFAIWENMQAVLDKMFKDTGHQNAYFPLLIPLSFMEQEAKHVEGFAKECAVVTHHRLTESDGKLIPTGELEEPFVIRPTSETIIGTQFAKWIQSYRDLPLLINQWANVMRWEMRTRLFLRTSEFLWQEGHTAHACADEAMAETLQMLRIYERFSHEYLAMPVICGEKTPDERFPGAVNTYSIEAMMQDGKALQAGTSHFLGQNFSRSFNIQFSNQQGELAHAWTTSWGVSTRLIGGLVMTHSDDDGLVLPPRVAPIHVVIIPILRGDKQDAVLACCEELKHSLSAQFFHEHQLRVKIDTRDINGGEKKWQAIKEGTPIRIEIGPKDVAKSQAVLCRRDKSSRDKTFLSLAEINSTIVSLLQSIQDNLYQQALSFQQTNTKEIDSIAAFKQHFEQENPGFVRCYSSTNEEIQKIIKPLKVSARCIPLEQPEQKGPCVFTNENDCPIIVYGRAY